MAIKQNNWLQTKQDFCLSLKPYAHSEHDSRESCTLKLCYQAWLKTSTSATFPYDCKQKAALGMDKKAVWMCLWLGEWDVCVCVKDD